MQQLLKRLGARQCEVIHMSQGQKISRLIAWSFLDKDDHLQWAQAYWS
jgi:23S rRNA (adenine1618-N6)-methyltransferase